MEDCIFCKIAKGQLPCYKIWEDVDFLAFLSIDPPIEGLTIVIPKKHYPSYFVKIDKEVLSELIEKTKIVANILDSKLSNVIRTKLVFEGLEMDHLHAKLYPMYRNEKENSKYMKTKATQEDLEKTYIKLIR